ncbi:hypothetical protein NE850_11555 [Paraburkholderia sp. USG1]|uniref:hypothetical protein n=1 Tax=Paraburkholderia sp. USG1 TaxID=2952268 RepID=UPI00285E097E|nr:hypothetical protein [Paraburkholderia sp. USG1]MDR8396975.1 hypothetical protein [Paraburkholderia sp. USG1]
MSEIDYHYWASLDKWTTTEAALLIDGKDPAQNRGVSLRAKDTLAGFENAAKIAKILERTNWTARYGRSPWEINKHPLYIADAIRSVGLEIPARLWEKLRDRHERETGAGEIQKEVNTSAATKERQTMLKLIIGLACGGYRLDPDATRNMYAKEMRIDLERAGVPLDDETIKKYLDEAKRLRRDLLVRRGT